MKEYPMLLSSPEIDRIVTEIDLRTIIKLQQEITSVAKKSLKGIDRMIDDYTKSLFYRVKYTNGIVEDPDISTVSELGQPMILFKGDSGYGKTDTMSAVSGAIKAPSQRIQCTADMQPNDVIGKGMMEDIETGRRITFEPGPIFNPLVQNDEVNRAKGGAMSAYIEAMEERCVTTIGKYFGKFNKPYTRLPLYPINGDLTDFTSPRFCMMTFTENPHGDGQGTYPTPWAILDRITMTIPVERPSEENEETVSDETIAGQYVSPVTDLTHILASGLHIFLNVRESIPATKYRVALLRNTNPKYVKGKKELVDYVREHIMKGASTRANFALQAASRAEAAFNESKIIKPEHIKAVAERVIAHRLIMKPGKNRPSENEACKRVIELTEPPPWK